MRGGGGPLPESHRLTRGHSVSRKLRIHARYSAGHQTPEQTQALSLMRSLLSSECFQQGHFHSGTYRLMLDSIPFSEIFISVPLPLFLLARFPSKESVWVRGLGLERK